MFGIYDGCDSICVCHRFKVGVFDIVFFAVGAMLVSIASIGFDVKIVVKNVVKIVVKIVVIVTVSFLNFIFPFNLV